MSSSPEAPAPGLWSQLRDRDHTRGRLWVSLVVLAAPLLATSLSGAMFQLLDLKFVSDIGEGAVTAVVVTNQSFRQIAMILLMGASFGAQGMISRMTGEGRLDDAEHMAGQILTMGFVISVGVAAAGLLHGEWMLDVMNVSPHIQQLALPYLHWSFAMSFGWIFVALFSAILNGAGDSTTPMLITLLYTAVSLLAEWMLIYGHTPMPPFRIESVALGQASGQFLGVSVALGVLFLGTSRIHVRVRHLVPDLRALRQLAQQAWAPALQMVGSFIVTAYFLRLSGEFSDQAQTAYSIGLRISMIGPMIAFPLAGACATLVGQNLGAGNVSRAWRAMWVSLAAHASILIGIASALLVYRVELVRWFATDPEVVALASELVAYQAGAFFAWAFYFVFFRTLQGAGDVFVPMVMATANSVFITLPIGWYLATQTSLGPTGLFQATVIGAFSVTLPLGAYLASGRWVRIGLNSRLGEPPRPGASPSENPAAPRVTEEPDRPE